MEQLSPRERGEMKRAAAMFALVLVVLLGWRAWREETEGAGLEGLSRQSTARRQDEEPSELSGAGERANRGRLPTGEDVSSAREEPGGAPRSQPVPRLRFEDGSPAAGLRVHVIERLPVTTDSPKQIREGPAQLLGTTSEDGALDFAWNEEQHAGLGVEYGPGCAALLSSEELAGRDVVSIPALAEHAFQLNLEPGVPPEVVDETWIGVQTTDAALWGSPWKNGVAPPGDLFRRWHLGTCRPLEEGQTFVLRRVPFTADATHQVLQLPHVELSAHGFVTPFGFGVVTAASARQFHPGGEVATLTLYAKRVCKLRVWSPQGERCSPPPEVRLAFKRQEKDGDWTTSAERRLRLRLSRPDSMEIEFDLYRADENRPVAIVADYGEDLQWESELHWNLPDVVDVQQP